MATAEKPSCERALEVLALTMLCKPNVEIADKILFVHKRTVEHWDGRWMDYYCHPGDDRSMRTVCIKAMNEGMHRRLFRKFAGHPQIGPEIKKYRAARALEKAERQKERVRKKK